MLFQGFGVKGKTAVVRVNSWIAFSPKPKSTHEKHETIYFAGVAGTDAEADGDGDVAGEGLGATAIRVVPW